MTIVKTRGSCPECKHPMKRHLPDGRCTVLGCGHDPRHLGQIGRVA